MASGDGAALYDATRELGVEGVVAKRWASRYTCGRRSRSWVKVKHRRTGWFDLAGYRVPSRRRPAGGLVLLDDGRPAGTALPAFPAAVREALGRMVERYGVTDREAVWMPPGIQVRVDFLERSVTGIVREGVARDLRPALPG